jgi:hypothetical protein
MPTVLPPRRHLHASSHASGLLPLLSVIAEAQDSSHANQHSVEEQDEDRAEGMNMAILDAIELASALCERYGKTGSQDRLQRYTSVRMPDIWRYEEFSDDQLRNFRAGFSQTFAGS